MRARHGRARLLTVTAAAALLIGSVSGPAASEPGPSPGAGAAGKGGERVLVFSKTAGFRHDSIPAGVAAVRELGAEGGFAVDATEDAAAFTAENLRRYDAVVWLSTTGDVLDTAQQRAFEGYIRGGGAYVGVHAAADTEYDWPFYAGLAGAYFQSHPAIQRAKVHAEDHAHPATSHLGTGAWERTDEWYNYRSNPRARARVLASLDESSYAGGTMSGDHPIAWCQSDYQGGRSFYTGGGHTKESYAEPAFRRHLLGGLRWAVGAVQADCRPEKGYTSVFDGTAASLSGWKQAGPGSFALDENHGTLTTVGGMGMLWYERRQLGTYSLKLDWRMRGDDNSGIFVGFPASDDPWSAVNNGYEIQIDATDVPERTTGSVYGFKSADLKKRDRALNPPGSPDSPDSPGSPGSPGEWNTYEIRVEGERLRVYLNGVKINDFTNTDPARSLRQGHIGIQNHGDADEVSFRNIRVKDLPAARPGAGH
ncbi:MULTISPECIES: ThuA domain-containing protein [Streptomyces]|uniref:ThuA domain-containing protein n=1 Tax=Streptomyces TaxID=1883 RepID=UPI001E4C68C6|nr:MULTISPECIES: ThuA domain-containing protein [Streptomyces]UFQ20450.1 ThuA domain-containing protein [Streptomyces huasconensis]WCL90058.1 ThuA domain-containing protein [Streptomyces sp. JCM 35825]